MKLSDYTTIILASKSPRRLEILRRHGVNPVVLPSDTDESLPDGIGMEDAVLRLSREKALAAENGSAAAILRDPASLPALLIASDTIVYKDEIMGKPADRADAFRMLSGIRGTYHSVATGVTLIHVGADREVHSFVDVTRVWCKDYSDEDIDRYIDQEQPYDKAGSYAIQSSFREHIDRIEGDYENVVGLPFYRIEAELNSMLASR